MKEPSCQTSGRLDHLGTILVTGTDASSFLQGQLSFDMTRLTSGYAELASVNSAQGRVQAVIWLVAREDGIALVVPAELVTATVARMRKFIMRAKARIDSGAGTLTVGMTSGDVVPAETRGHVEKNGTSVVHWPGTTRRGLVIAPTVEVSTDGSRMADWRLEDIRAGLPQVYTATHETFVAQMLNLDLLQGISFDKGCYTGQEIIARMHFRGQVKRRMLRFAFAGPAPAPGTRIVSGGNHAGDVVDAVDAETGSELLAVINLAQRESRLEIEGVAGIALEALSLPYEVK